MFLPTLFSFLSGFDNVILMRAGWEDEGSLVEGMWVPGGRFDTVNKSNLLGPLFAAFFAALFDVFFEDFFL